MIGDVIAALIGAGGVIKGLVKIVKSFLGGVAVTVTSGGGLVVAGMSISLSGGAVGTTEVAVGGAILNVASCNLKNDIRQMKEAKEGSGKTNTGTTKIKTPDSNPKDFIKQRGNQGWKDKKGNTWKKDQLHKDHWDISNGKGNKIQEIDYNGNEIWPNGPKNNNKRP